MRVITNQCRFATIGIISGHPRYDQYTARIMDTLKQQSTEPLNFIGSIGTQYSDKLSERFASSSILAHQEITYTRNFYLIGQDNLLNLPRSNTVIRNFVMRRMLRYNDFFNRLIEHQTKAVIIVGNFCLMKTVFKDVNNMCKVNNTAIPLRLGFDELVAYRNVGDEDYVDFMYNNLPKLPINLSKYVFPSLCIGYEGLFKAFQFLFKENKVIGSDVLHAKEFSSKQMIVNLHRVAEAVRKARTAFRKSVGFTENEYVTLLAVGESQKEATFSIKKFGEGLRVFREQQQIKAVSNSHFKVLVLLPQDKKLTEFVKQKVNSLGLHFAVTFIENKDKYAAMCGSDFAVLHNGEVTVEGAACQLPAMVINSMSNIKAYVSYLYNGHESPLNVSTNFEGYQQLNGSLTAIGNKIGSIMLDNFKTPKLRPYYVKLYRQEIQRMLSLSGRNPEMDVTRTGLQVAAADILRKISLKEELSPTVQARKYDRKKALQLY